MKVLMFSTDENIFKDNSESQNRMKDYGTLVEELHIVIKNKKSKIKNQNFGNVFVYPTNDRFWFSYFFNAYRIAKKIISQLQTTNYKLLTTCQDPFETGLVGYWLKKKFNLPLQLQIHADFLSPYFWRESIGNKVRVILGRWLVKKADGLRVVSERIKESLMVSGYTSSSPRISEPNGLNPIMVLPIFVDAQQIKESPININLRQKYLGRFIILMASRLTKEKNIGLAIESARNLIPNHPSLLLLIVGSGPESEKLKTISYKLKANVIFEPWCDDLTSYYKTADLFLLTSNYEGYGRTVVEATAAGLPVLMTDVGVAVGAVVPVDDKKAIVEKLKFLIKNKSEREIILESQKKFLEFYKSKEDYLKQIKQSWQNCFS